MMGLLASFFKQGQTISALSVVWPLQEGGRECAAKASSLRQKDRKETTSGTNKMICSK